MVFLIHTFNTEVTTRRNYHEEIQLRRSTHWTTITNKKLWGTKFHQTSSQPFWTALRVKLLPKKRRQKQVMCLVKWMVTWPIWVITDLRESTNVYQNRKHPSTIHQVVLIGDSNMRGYVSSLEPLLNSNYNLYSVMKTGSDTNELKKSANEMKPHLWRHDNTLLWNQWLWPKNRKNPKNKFSCTFQNIKNFIMNNNHTNILLMNIPFRYDITNTSYVKKIILRLNVNLMCGWLCIVIQCG